MWSVFAAFGYYDKANYFFCREVRLSILEQNYWSITDRQAALPTASRQQLETFVKLLTQQFRLESLIQGNFTAQVGFIKRTCTNWRCLYQCYGSWPLEIFVILSVRGLSLNMTSTDVRF